MVMEKINENNLRNDAYCPNGIDIYFENVGGKMLEAVLNHVNKYARIPLCGMISDYNTPWTEREGVRNLLNMVGKEVMMKGFLVRSYLNRFGDFVKEMEGYFKLGKINSKHKVYNGIESFQECFASLFTSSNVGKVVIQNNECSSCWAEPLSSFRNSLHVLALSVRCILLN
ncbi:unnamed protein product [Thlaspi arvense]|uniref:Alcohol dehydrogenase-like C-terminal domain-containing protein n=1 Tax=Thlaspi arvense TaxID=13288 RepID=A0AAU9TCI8_THLAR|nr:unnamed protein product [Thlaspi arvense]